MLTVVGIALGVVALALVIALAIPLTRRVVVMLFVLARRMLGRACYHARIERFEDYTTAKALRLAFEDLGPTYIKFGQMIASSPTAFSEEVTDEFAKCLDEVRTMSADTVNEIITHELGRDPEDVFAAFDYTPLASASIAQVHTAELHTGEKVVVKVQRPGIRHRIRADLNLLGFAAKLVVMKNPELRRANLTGIVDDFRSTITEEMDFIGEARNIDEFTALLEQEGLDKVAHAPRVHHELSTEKIITMERLFGCRIDDKRGVDSRIDDPVQMLRDTSQVFWTCVFLGGFFHGDIHAGNIMVLDDGRLGYLDFGIFGRFDMNDRIALAEWVGALIADDGEQLARSIARMGAVPPDVDWDEFVVDITEAFLPLRALTVDKPEMLEEFVPKLREGAAKHNASLPGNFVLILKQLTYFGRYVMMHEPSFNENLDPHTQASFFKMFVKFNALRAAHEAEETAAQTPAAIIELDRAQPAPAALAID